MSVTGVYNWRTRGGSGLINATGPDFEPKARRVTRPRIYIISTFTNYFIPVIILNVVLTCIHTHTCNYICMYTFDASDAASKMSWWAQSEAIGIYNRMQAILHAW